MKVKEDEIRKQRLNDPDVQARLRQIHQAIENDPPLSTGIDSEALPGFLREREGSLEPGP